MGVFGTARIWWFGNKKLGWQANSQVVTRRSVETGNVRWRRLDIGKLKCNVDRAIFAYSGRMGWAAVVQNDSDDFVRCISDFMKSTLDPFRSEILAVREAFSRLKSLHLDNTVMKIDS